MWRTALFKNGQVRWTYDPRVPRERAYFICCDVVNRGVALYHGKVYAGTLDGWPIVLDEHSGTPVSVLAGWGGSPGLFNAPGSGTVKPGYGRIVTFMLDGTATLKAPAFGHKDPPVAPAITTSTSPQIVKEGGLAYNSQCAPCHGVDAVAGSLPDLRYASKETLEGIDSIVLGGSRAALGMPSFRKILNAGQVRAIQAYIVSRAREAAK